MQFNEEVVNKKPGLLAFGLGNYSPSIMYRLCKVKNPAQIQKSTECFQWFHNAVVHCSSVFEVDPNEQALLIRLSKYIFPSLRKLEKFNEITELSADSLSEADCKILLTKMARDYVVREPKYNSIGFTLQSLWAVLIIIVTSMALIAMYLFYNRISLTLKVVSEQNDNALEDADDDERRPQHAVEIIKGDTSCLLTLNLKNKVFKEDVQNQRETIEIELRSSGSKKFEIKNNTESIITAPNIEVHDFKEQEKKFVEVVNNNLENNESATETFFETQSDDQRVSKEVDQTEAIDRLLRVAKYEVKHLKVEIPDSLFLSNGGTGKRHFYS